MTEIQNYIFGIKYMLIVNLEQKPVTLAYCQE